MTLLPLRRPEADDATLLRRAARGDRRAHRLFARRHAARALELVELLVDGQLETTTLAAAVLDATIAAGIAGDDSLVRCAVQILLPAGAETGLARLVISLTDVDGRTEDDVATLVGRTVDEVALLRAGARSDLGAARAFGSDCRGWALAARRDRLTVSEQEAANGHLSLCRSCRARLDEQRRTRDKLRMSGTAASAVLVADVVALSVPTGGAVAGASGLASLVLGKAGVAGVGAAAVAIAATSAGVAVARHAHVPVSNPGGVVRNTTTHGTRPASGTAVPRDVRASTASQTGAGTAPSSAPTRRIAPLPTTSPPAPSTVLTAVPSTLPLPLPTSVTLGPSIAPLPKLTTTPTLPVTVPVTVPTNVVSTAPSLLGH